MSLVITEDKNYQDIADMIRTKNHLSTLYRPSEMAGAIRDLPIGSKDVEVLSMSATANGVYTASHGYAYTQIDVDVPDDHEVIGLTVTENGEYTAPSGVAYSPVEVQVSEIGIDDIEIHENGVYSAPYRHAYHDVVVSTPVYEPRSIDITQNGTYSASSGTGYQTVIVSVASSVNYAALNAYIDGTLSYYENASLSQVSDFAFCGCSMLSSVSLPNCKSIGSCAFSRCISLSTVSFPLCTTISSHAFEQCEQLTSVSLPVCTNIDRFAFASCYSLTHIYLLGNSVARLSNSNCFEGTPIYPNASGSVSGSIFVRASLLTAWQASNVWSVFSSRFVGLTDEEIGRLE